METTQAKTRSHLPAIVALVQVPILGVMTYLLVNNQGGAAGVISLIAVAIASMFIISFVLSILRTFVCNMLEKRLHASLFALGFHYELKNKTGRNTFWPPFESKRKLFRYQLVLFTEYVLNAWCLQKGSEEARIICPSSFSPYEPHHAYGSRRLNYEVYSALRLSMGANKKLELKNEEKLHLLAAYIFVELSKNISARQVDMVKVMFLYRNGYSSRLALHLKDTDMSTLAAFEDIPPSWVTQALFGEANT